MNSSQLPPLQGELDKRISHHQPNFRQLGRFLSLAVIVSLLFGACNVSSSGLEQEELFPKQLVAAPIPEISDFFEVFTIDPTLDTTFQTQSGTRVYVPANSIVNTEGALVNEMVEIRFREIRKAHEIIASGIPMRYFDETGSESWMQTAGMFEVNGSLRGEQVAIAAGKTITVEFAAETSEPVDFWYFDAVSGNWANKAQNTTGTENLPVSDPDALPGEVAPPPPPPIQPVIGNPKKILPPLKIDYKFFPELKEFRNLEWEYTGPAADNPRNDPSFFDKWDNLVINKGTGSSYRLTFSRSGESLDVPVRPCFRRAKDLEAFNQSMTAYRKKQQEYDAYVIREQERETFRQRQYGFIRQVSIQEFGIFNWDYLIKADVALPLVADFDFEVQLPEHLEKDIIVYLITGEGRSVISFPKYDWARFSYRPEMDNRLVAVLPDGRVAVFSQEQFNAEKDQLQNARNQAYQFKMKVLPDRVDNLQDLEQIGD
ncbi:hypothetical protein [Flavilitoribacter nigricans]|uniref:Uncharacterized protein n=1 Tax=Flavilitoribacter nigricans (strain ATCC 23147 / DSM 23189 / NBRC 102662 / NCIMB 1420 / SS-2) TaxID=1122177 RepID=A0A2D0NIV5_FLAN2|nr:hypothetical protein [Flavilitoribacter nigricans]PHN08129.1 hypothetical protein CRP01_02065 [Flavilitoribacter nigricans DSM 23189 = NBRC 102662]